MGTITKYQVEQAGLVWVDISKKLMDNGWVEKVSPTEMRLKANLDTTKDTMLGVFGNDFSKILSILQQTKMDDGKYIELYKEIFEVERTKAGIYSNLWTFLVGVITTLFGLYYHSKNLVVQVQSNQVQSNLVSQVQSSTERHVQVHGEIYILIIPFFVMIWSAFVIFNYMYLQTTRGFLRKLEEKIFENEYRLFANVYDKEIKRKASPFLFSLAGAALIFSFGYILRLCFKELKPTPEKADLRGYYLGALIVIAALGLIIYLISTIFVLKRTTSK